MLRNGLEVPILGAIAAIAAGVWLFVEVAEGVVEGKAGKIDAAILMALRSSTEPGQPFGPEWLKETMRDISGLGGPEVLSMLVAVAVVFLLLAARRRTALFVGCGALGGAIVSILLKAGFSRPRPDLAPHATYVYSASFPSGHAMLSAVVYLTFGVLIARLTPRPGLKVYVMGVAAALCILVGISRVYLGAHWPSDVLAGWAAGTAWAFGCQFVARFLNLEEGAQR